MNHLDYVCPYCWHTIDECICKIKPWHLVNIDQNMQEIIRILNQKGYITEYCCESHNPNGNMYIKFQHCYDIPKPDGFDFNKMQTISFIYKPGITYEEYEKQKKDHLDSLLKWCKELPYKK